MQAKMPTSDQLAAWEENLNNRSVHIDVDLAAIRANLRTARLSSSGSKQFATIKADAYGHGAVAVAQALSPSVEDLSLSGDLAATGNQNNENYADGFAVVSVDEALQLRSAGIQQPILVLQGPQSQDACADMLHFNLWPVIHDMNQYEWYRQHKQRGELRAWLKVDTGMGRLGVQPDQAIAILSAQDGIQWMGLMTHFACADEPDNPFTLQQIEQFTSVCAKVERGCDLQQSMANSAAVMAWPQARADWARPGIMLYGCNPLDRDLPEGVCLQMAMSVSAPLISTKVLPGGAGVGYAQTWRCPEQMPIGYVALGYRDGLPRILDSSACVDVGGALCPVVGRVSMDSIAIDLRPATDARIGNMATFWGPDTSIDALAKAAGTINYELLTSIRGRRTYIN